MIRDKGRGRLLLTVFLLVMMTSVMTPGVQAAWKKNSDGTYSYYDNGKLARNKWIDEDYYVNAKGVRHTGWLYKNKNWYYFAPSGKLIRSKWLHSSGKIYYASEAGALLTNGKYQVKDDCYAFNSRGLRLTGSRKYGGKYYFFGYKTGKMLKKQWVSINGKKYYYGKDGARVTSSWVGRYYVDKSGARLINTWKGKKYLGSDGKAVTGLQKIGSYYYYFDKKTFEKAVSCTLEVDNSTYKFDSKGRGKVVSTKKAPSTTVNVESTYYTDKYVEDEKLLAAIIYCEAGNQEYKGKVAVGMVIMNRVYSPLFPNKLREIVYQKNQFTPAANGSLTRAVKNYSTMVTAECQKAARTVLSKYTNYTEGKEVYLTIDGKKTTFPYLFFMTSAAYNRLGLTASYKKIGAHVFFKTWK